MEVVVLRSTFTTDEARVGNVGRHVLQHPKPSKRRITVVFGDRDGQNLASKARVLPKAEGVLVFENDEVLLQSPRARARVVEKHTRAAKALRGFTDDS